MKHQPIDKFQSWEPKNAEGKCSTINETNTGSQDQAKRENNNASGQA